ncbi:MAG: LytTR family transcriptional regulator DNA-binding domain-containing protein [Eubacterium sp.]|nr:LytTR family transcriptional regulator DNA-binding domain-containing protein [Eubacterium sp.]
MENNGLPVITRSVSAVVDTDDLLMIQREGRKLHVCTEKREYVMYGKMQNVLQYLDSRFFRCLDGCVINLTKVRRVEKCRVVFRNGRELTLGRDSSLRVRRAFNLLLFDHGHQISSESHR